METDSVDGQVVKPGQRSNAEWIRALTDEGPARAGALAELRAGMLRVIRSCLARREVRTDRESLAQDCAQEALLLALKHLHTFRGDSRFTTWAFQIAIRQALGALREQRWRLQSLELPAGDHPLPERPIESADPGPERRAQQAQVWQALREIIEQHLTARQRQVLEAAVFRGMPLDLLANSLGTTRDNIYKILHDARRSLRRHLLAQHLTYAEILEPFRDRG